MTKYLNPKAMTSTDWLAGHLDMPGLRVFECTTYLDPPTPGVDAPYTVRPGRADYDQGHIPGAGFLDIQGELSDSHSPSHLRFTMPEPDVLAATFAQRGIGDEHRVVLYSRGNIQWATRVWWMLRAIGVDNTAILDGGWDKWASEGRAVSTQSCTYPPASLKAAPRPGLFATRSQVEAAMGDASTCVINALSAELHTGRSERYGRPGRIPGSENVPALSLLDGESNTFLDAETVARAFEEAGATDAVKTIVYCGGGIAATLDAYLMTQLGYKDVSVYDASLSEWARDESLPMETG